jgi:hypothetical protein
MTLTFNIDSASLIAVVVAFVVLTALLKVERRGK